MADDRGEGGAIHDDGFAERLKSKAQELRRIATEKRVAELNDDIAAGTLHREGEDSDLPTMTTHYIESGSAEWKEIYGNYEWVSTMFDTLSKLPDPSKFAPATEDMDKVRTELGTPVEESGKLKIAHSATGKVATVAGRLSGWQGDAKETWITFSGNWVSIVGNQVAVAGLVKFAAAAHGEIYGKSRRDAESLAVKAKKALLHTGTDVKEVLEVAIAVASVANVFTPFGKLGQLALLAAETIAGELPEKPELELGAFSVNGVLDKLFDAITELTGRISDQELVLRKALNGGLTEIAKARRERTIVPTGLGDVTDLRAGHLSGMSPA